MNAILPKKPLFDVLEQINNATWQAQALVIAIPVEKDDGFWVLNDGLHISYLDTVIDKLSQIENGVKALELVLSQSVEVVA